MKKYLGKTFLLLIILVLGLPGCVNKPAPGGKKEIEVWTIQLSNFSGYMNSVIAEYERKNPDIAVKWVDVPFPEAEKRALAAVLSGNPPDLINMNPDFSGTLASKGSLLELSGLLPPGEYGDYLEPAWLASSINSSIFGIPWYITSAVTIYNREIWDGEPPKTYEDLPDIAKKIDKYVLMPTLTENGMMLKIFSKYDIPIVSKDRTRALFNTKKAEEVLYFWKYMYDNGFIPGESITEGHRESLEKFMAGETAFINAGENFLNIIKENAPQIYGNIGISRQLTGSNGKAGFSVMNFVIPKKSRYPLEALNFALFLTNTENQLKFSELASVLPSRKDVTRLQGALLKPLPALRNRKDLYEIADFMTQEVLLGRKTPKQALDKAVKEWEAILAE